MANMTSLKYLFEPLDPLNGEVTRRPEAEPTVGMLDERWLTPVGSLKWGHTRPEHHRSDAQFAHVLVGHDATTTDSELIQDKQRQQLMALSCYHTHYYYIISDCICPGPARRRIVDLGCAYAYPRHGEGGVGSSGWSWTKLMRQGQMPVAKTPAS
jgi:hypothetical protein